MSIDAWERVKSVGAIILLAALIGYGLYALGGCATQAKPFRHQHGWSETAGRWCIMDVGPDTGGWSSQPPGRRGDAVHHSGGPGLGAPAGGDRSLCLRVSTRAVGPDEVPVVGPGDRPADRSGAPVPDDEGEEAPSGWGAKLPALDKAIEGLGERGRITIYAAAGLVIVLVRSFLYWRSLR